MKLKPFSWGPLCVYVCSGRFRISIWGSRSHRDHRWKALAQTWHSHAFTPVFIWWPRLWEAFECVPQNHHRVSQVTSLHAKGHTLTACFILPLTSRELTVAAAAAECDVSRRDTSTLWVRQSLGMMMCYSPAIASTGRCSDSTDFHTLLTNIFGWFDGWPSGQMDILTDHSEAGMMVGSSNAAVELTVWSCEQLDDRWSSQWINR